MGVGVGAFLWGSLSGGRALRSASSASSDTIRLATPAFVRFCLAVFYTLLCSYLRPTELPPFWFAGYEAVDVGYGRAEGRGGGRVGEGGREEKRRV